MVKDRSEPMKRDPPQRQPGRLLMHLAKEVRQALVPLQERRKFAAEPGRSASAKRARRDDGRFTNGRMCRRPKVKGDPPPPGSPQSAIPYVVRSLGEARQSATATKVRSSSSRPAIIPISA